MRGPGRHTADHPVPLGPAARATVVLLAVVVVAVMAVQALRPTDAPSGADGSGASPERVSRGLLTFRGNEARAFLGTGPIPREPVIRWSFPPSGEPPLCSFSAEGLEGSEPKEWCGTGWTGQPNVVRSGDAVEVRIGTFDGSYRFLDAGSGRELRPPLATGDLAKGSATSDPEGYPLYYAGSRDNLFRVVALDRPEPTVLWSIESLDTVDRPMWNDDWDGAALVVGDDLLVGGENGWLYVVELGRGYDADGIVQVDPEIIATIPGFDDELLAAIEEPGEEPAPGGLDTRYDVSIENSVAFRDGIVYFANSGGLVQGWDVADLLTGGRAFSRVLRFWTGDDTDATVVIDEGGALYVASEYQRFNERSRRLGQLMKLDPSRPGDPVEWTVPAMELGFEGAGGSWSTPAVFGGHVYFTTAAGRLLEVDRGTGEVVWELQVGTPAISSPVVIDGVLIQGDCSGRLNAWDVSDPAVAPPLLWSLDLGDCIESTPAAWDGWLYVGTREGYVYGIADAGTAAPAG